jgi:hypothetical protein
MISPVPAMNDLVKRPIKVGPGLTRVVERDDSLKFTPLIPAAMPDPLRGATGAVRIMRDSFDNAIISALEGHEGRSS